MNRCIALLLLCLPLMPLPGFSHNVNGEGPTRHPLILQADFAGLVMTGVAYSVDAQLTVHNVRPLIPLYDIAAASASLAYNAQSWPSGSVFVSVVDPGVGTPRKSVVLKTRNGLYFVSPDNGSLSGPAAEYGIEAVREIDEQVNRIPGTEWSHTFHGRDVYSYTGARLAAGVIDFEGVGPLLPPQVIELPRPAARRDGDALIGSVTGGTGRLGNVSFSIDRELFQSMQPAFGDSFVISISHEDETIWSGSLPYARSFGSVAVGKPLLFINSSGELAVAINQGNFAATHGISAGSDWTVTVRRSVTQPSAAADEDGPAAVDAAVSSPEDSVPLAESAQSPSALTSVAGSPPSTEPPVSSREHWIRSRNTYIPATLVTPTGAASPLPLVLLLHGHGGTRHEAGGFTKMARTLARRGIASIRMDFPGSGESIEPFRHNNLTTMLADARAGLTFAQQHLTIDRQRLGVLGFSMGGRVAIHLSPELKGLKALALWAPSATDGADHLMNYVGGPERWQAMKAQANTQGYAPFTTFWGQQQQLGPRWFKDLETSQPSSALTAFDEALLVVYGDLDTVIPPKDARAVIAKASNARLARAHEVQGADHGFGLFNERPELTAETILTTAEFLADQLLGNRGVGSTPGR